MVHILDENKIKENYEKFRKLINQTFTGERLEKLNKMYDELEDRIILTPASSTEHFHNAFAGGYIDHILRVTYNAVKIYDLYKELGMPLDFEKDTLIFTALHHDLGKVGNHEENWYIPNDSQWHIENQGKIYKTSSKMHWMNLNDRTMWLLNHYGITLTEEEYIGIKLTDGMYDEANKAYLMSYNPDFGLRSNMPHILHQADMMSTYIESDQWKRGSETEEPMNTKVPKTKDEQKQVDNLKSKFDELFN